MVDRAHDRRHAAVPAAGRGPRFLATAIILAYGDKTMNEGQRAFMTHTLEG